MDDKKNNIVQTVREGAKKVLFIVGMFSFFVNVLMLTLPIYMLQIFDRVLASFSSETLLYLTLIASFMLVIFGALTAIRSYILIHLSDWLDRTISPATLSRSIDELLRNNPYASQALEDIMTIRQFLNGPAVVALFDIPWVPIYVFVIFLLNAWLGILAFFGAVGLFVCSLLNDHLTRKHITTSKEDAQQAQQQYRLIVNNPATIQSMGMVKALNEKWYQQHVKSLDSQNIASKRGSEILALSKFLRLLLQVLMLGGGAYLVITNRFTPGMMIAGTILLARALAPVEQTIAAWRQVTLARQAYHRLSYYFSLKSPRIEMLGLPLPTGQIVVKEAGFLLPDIEQPILYNINFRVNPGELLAIAGPSAAGKSSLARLIVGALPVSRGSVRLDGVDIYQWSREEIGQHIGYLSQQPQFFVGTVRENIARMQQDVDEQVMSATALACVHELVLSLPQGYDTIIKPGGSNLSGGQIQQVALARALFNNPQLIMLDEPSAHLDAFAKQNFFETLVKLQQLGKTIIVITHQADVMKCADRLLLLNEGTVYRYGPTDKVLASLQENAVQQQRTQ